MKKYISILSIISAAFILTGCGAKKSLYSKYERPEVNDTQLVRNPVGEGLLSEGDTASVGNLPWRTVFTDPQLQKLIETGLQNNSDLLNAALNVEIAKQQLKTSRLAFLPGFVFNPSGTLNKVLTGDFKSDWGKSYSLPVDASWNIDLFGNLLSQKRSAQMALIASEDHQQAVRSGLICHIANCYYTLLMLDEQLRILNDMQSLTKETWEMMKIQKELRGTRETSVISAEASYYSIQSDAVDMRRQIREVENSLSLLIGQQAQAISRGTLASQSLPANLSTGVSVGILANRPDVHAQEMQLAQCFHNIQTARSRFYPQLTINAEGAFTNSLGSMVANPGQFLAAFIGSLTQPIFSQGKITAGLRVAEAQYQKAYNSWQNSLLKAGSEVSDALVLYNSSQEKALVDQHQVEILTKNVEYTRDIYKMGNSSYLEVIGAEKQLLNARLSKVIDDFNKMQAVVNLYSALGGGKN